MPQDGSQNYYYPPGTRGITDETIESAAYNNFLDDLVEHDLNIPRPIHRGGTGAITADKALINLGAEKAAQVVTNYDSHVWLPGSFRSAAGATAAPVADHAFAGIVYLGEPYLDPPTNANVVVSARDLDDTQVPSRVYVREKKANVWGAWTVIDASTLPLPPGIPGLDATTILAAIQELALEKADKTYVDETKVAKAGGADGIMTGHLTLPTGPAAANAVRKDYVDNIFTVIGVAPLDAVAYNGMQINGGMEINQEGALALNLGTSGVFGYGADGIGGKSTGTGAQVNHQPMVSALVPVALPGFNNCVYLRFPTANAALAATHQQWLTMPLEGYRVSRLGYGGTAAQPLTVAFWVMAHDAGTMAVALQNEASNRSYVVDVPITAPLTWQYKTVTIPGDTTGTWQKTTGIGLKLHFCLGAGSNFVTAPNGWANGNFAATASTTNFAATADRSVFITGVTVLPGTSAPSAAQSQLLVRPADQELPLCLRYFQMQRSITSATILATGVAYTAGSPGSAIFHVRFPVHMRVAPTLVTSGTPNNYMALGASGVGGPASAISTSVNDNTVQFARIDIQASGLTAGQALTLHTTGPTIPLGFNARMTP